MNTLYKGYIKTKGKKAIEAFKDRTKYRTYDEVKNLEGFGGVLADDTILIDIDDAEQSEILMNIVEEYQLNRQNLEEAVSMLDSEASAGAFRGDKMGTRIWWDCKK